MGGFWGGIVVDIVFEYCFIEILGEKVMKKLWEIRIEMYLDIFGCDFEIVKWGFKLIGGDIIRMNILYVVLDELC